MFNTQAHDCKGRRSSLYKHIIFDFDGTIVDSVDSLVEVYNGLSDKFGFNKISQNDYRLINNLPIKERLKVLGIPFYRLFFMGGLDQEFMNGYKKHVKNIKFFEGVEELLYQLKDLGFKLSIISSNSEDNIFSFLKVNELEIFDDIHSSKGFFGKNHTIRKYLKKHELSNKDVIYIGDEIRDIKACKKADIDIISVTWGLDNEELLKSGKPTYIVSEYNDILDIVKK